MMSKKVVFVTFVLFMISPFPAISAAAQLNILANPGFESGTYKPLNWSFVTNKGNTPMWDTISHSGARSIKIYVPWTRDRKSGYPRSDLIKVEPLQNYKLSGWGKTKSAGGTNAPAIRVVELDANEIWLRQTSLVFDTNTNDWTQKRISFQTGANTRWVYVYANIWYGYGTFWVDDLELSLTTTTTSTTPIPPTPKPTPTPVPTISIPPKPKVYQGAWVPDTHWEPWKLTDFENQIGKNLSIIHWYQGWGSADGYQDFQAQWMDNARKHGSIPMVTWEPYNYYDSNGPNQPNFSLKNIINGNFDSYITKWAQDSKAWGHPYFLRFAHEMNGDWYPWSEKVNGNSPGDYVKAWRHVHDIFTANKVTTVTWVWSPNVEYSSSTIPLERLYPGDSYVDWLGMDGYNGGTGINRGSWQTFPEIFNSTYYHLLKINPDKPIMIPETASSEIGGSKTDWIKDVYQTQLPNNYPKIKAIVWFDEKLEADWRVESSPSALSAYTRSIVSTYYASNSYGDLDISPIPPP